ncbi:unnamed protein product [Caenorhabditis auriculariae]|uniref:Uncharacterized protein n=1 Tax=Caenorhabditis auriculariae TaxID=2777116 RepID=A0A8S1HEF4_9PELO|nr:unnamed protein product [Caenorhabditis auriculariae]
MLLLLLVVGVTSIEALIALKTDTCDSRFQVVLEAERLSSPNQVFEIINFQVARLPFKESPLMSVSNLDSSVFTLESSAIPNYQFFVDFRALEVLICDKYDLTACRKHIPRLSSFIRIYLVCKSDETARAIVAFGLQSKEAEFHSKTYNMICVLYGFTIMCLLNVLAFSQLHKDAVNFQHRNNCDVIGRKKSTLRKRQKRKEALS